MAKRIAVIGGGASGMMAAITAAHAGADVTIYEKRERVGQKILATGNGRCNLSNLSLSVSSYDCDDPAKLTRCLAQFGVTETIRVFERLGLLVKAKEGRLYPVSGQASQVLNVMRLALGLENVKIFVSTAPSDIRQCDRGFLVKSRGEGFFYDRLILTCGSHAGEERPTQPDGYTYAEAFGHRHTRLLPALCALRCPASFPVVSLAGVRAQASIRLVVNRKDVCREEGELQLTGYGLSGIPIFQVSHLAARALADGESVSVVVDFLPWIREAEWMEKIEERLDERLARVPEESVESFLTGTVHQKILLFLTRQAGLRPGASIGEYGRNILRQLLLSMKRVTFPINGMNPLSQAQICSGGIPLSQLDEQLCSRNVPGLYFAGELLNVNGRCGGYNLQWAWTSGHIAGLAAAR